MPRHNMSIAENRKALYNYHIEERFEAGMVLEGWEVKAIRDGQVQMTDGYVVIKNGELYLIGLRINALRSASTHVTPDADRTKAGIGSSLERQSPAHTFHGVSTKARRICERAS